MIDLIVIAVVALIVGAAALYIRREKKQGNPCFGCPHAKSCGSRANCGCGTDS